MNELIKTNRDIFDLHNTFISLELLNEYLAELTNYDYSVHNYDLDLGRQMNLLSDLMLEAIKIPKDISESNPSIDKLKCLRNAFFASSIKLKQCVRYAHMLALDVKNQKLALKIERVNQPSIIGKYEIVSLAFEVLKRMSLVSIFYSKKYDLVRIKLETAIFAEEDKINIQIRKNSSIFDEETINNLINWGNEINDGSNKLIARRNVT